MGLIRSATLAISVLVFASCSDSHDKLMNDQVSWIQEVTGVLNEVAAGNLSSSDAAGKIKALGKQGEKFTERKKALNAKVSPAELAKVGKEHSEKIAEAFRDYMAAVARLSESGRMTRELADALENMKTL